MPQFLDLWILIINLYVVNPYAINSLPEEEKVKLLYLCSSSAYQSPYVVTAMP